MVITVKIFEICQFSSKFAYRMIWVKIFENFKEYYENLNLGQNSWKSRFWSKLSKIPDLGQIWKKMAILVKR